MAHLSPECRQEGRKHIRRGTKREKDKRKTTDGDGKTCTTMHAVSTCVYNEVSALTLVSCGNLMKRHCIPLTFFPHTHLTCCTEIFVLVNKTGACGNHSLLSKPRDCVVLCLQMSHMVFTLIQYVGSVPALNLALLIGSRVSQT